MKEEAGASLTKKGPNRGLRRLFVLILRVGA